MSDKWICEIPYREDSGNQHGNVISNVAEAILHGTPLIAPMEEGIRGLELGNAMLLSGLRDKTIELPLDSADYAAELEKLIATSRYHKKNIVVDGSLGDFSKSF